MVDLNRKLSSTLALRFNAIRRLDLTFQDASDYKFEGETLAVGWRPFKNTNVRIEAEQGKYANNRGFAGIYVREQSARGRGFNTSSTYFTSDGVWVPAFSGTGGIPAIDRGSSNGVAGGEPTLIEGEYFDVQMRNSTGTIIGSKRITGFPMNYNLRGSFDNHSRPFHTISITVEQQIGPVSTELAYNYQHQQEERNDNSFDQTISVDVNGRPYIDSSLDRKLFRNDVHAFRGTAAYTFDKFKWMQQLFVASAEYREDQVLNHRTQWFNIFGKTPATLNTTNDRVRLRIYLDDPAFYSRALFDRMQPGVLPATSSSTSSLPAAWYSGLNPLSSVNAVPLHFFASGTSAADGTEWRQAYSTSLSASGRYLSGKLQSLLGVRWDWGRQWEYKAVRKEGSWNEDIYPPTKKAALPGEYVENMNLHLSNTSYTAGLTYALTKDVNLYGIYSESFRFQDARTFDRETIGPISGKTKEIGLKGSLFHDRASISLGVFQIDRQNVVLSWNNIISFSDTDTEDLMNPAGVNPGDPGYKYREPGTASASRNYTAIEGSKGFDLTLMLRPTKNLQLRFTVARAIVDSQPNLQSFRGYYTAAVARAEPAEVAVVARAKLLLDTLDNTAGAVGARAAPWSASWIIDYAIPSDRWRALKGVRAGVNGIWRDDYLFGVSNGVKQTGGATHLVNAYIMRDQKIWGKQVRIRAGVTNLTDLANNKIRSTGFTNLANGTTILRYSYVMPPQYDLSVTARF
jgi:hypothetical protein